MKTASFPTFEEYASASVNKDRVAKGFDKAAKCYQDHSSIQKQVSQDALAKLYVSLGINSNEDYELERDWLLDIGCGPALYSEQLSKLCNNLIGIDIAHAMLQQAQRSYSQHKEPTSVAQKLVNKGNKGAKSFLLANCDAECLAIKPNSIDVIFSSMALQWCSSPHIALQEVFRTLKPKGSALLAIMVGESFSHLHNAFKAIGTPSRVNRFYSTNDWLKASNIYDWCTESHLKNYVSYHTSTFSMLKSIKQIGANTLVSAQQSDLNKNNRNNTSSSTTKAYLSKQELNNLDQYFKENHYRNSNFPLEYQVLYLSIHK